MALRASEVGTQTKLQDAQPDNSILLDLIQNIMGFKLNRVLVKHVQTQSTCSNFQMTNAVVLNHHLSTCHYS